MFKNERLRQKKVIVPLLILSALVLILFVFFTGADRAMLLGGHRTFVHDGITRTYRAHEKLSDSKENTDIIVVIHGFRSSAWQMAYITGMHNVANENSIVVYPNALKPNRDGLKTGWNAGYCCGSGWVNKTDDVDFIMSLTQELTEKHDLKNPRISIVGFSNGAFMAQRIGAERPDGITAIISAAGAFGANDTFLETTGPVPVLLMHGTNDTTVPFAGGPGSGDPDFIWPSHQETVDFWQNTNQDKAVTEVFTYPKKHVWQDWRLLRIWHQNPEASERSIEFIDSVE